MSDDQKFGMRLVEAGLITYEQLEQALRLQSIEDGRLGELLVRLGYVSEATVLQFLAAEFHTRYVSTERLARARIQQHVLEMVPVEIAEKYNLIPVLYDAQTDTLSIVTSDPQREDQLREVHRLTNVKELRVYVALRSAVQAAIRKHYHKDPTAFDELLKNKEIPAGGQEQFVGSSYGLQPSISDYPGTPNYGGNYAPPYNNNPYDPPGHSSPFSSQNNYYPYQQSPSPYDYNNYYQGYGSDSLSQDSYDYDDDEFDKTRIHPSAFSPSPESYNQPYKEGESSQPSGETVLAPLGGPPLASPKTPLAQYQPNFNNIKIIELIRFLAKKVELQNPRYRYHLSRQRPLLEAILRRFELHPNEKQYIQMAINLHHIDLPEPHYTQILLEELPQDKVEELKKKHLDFVERLEQFNLPEEVILIIKHLYERVDGKGFPDRLEGDKIPLGSRIITILDSYEELLQNEEGHSPLEIAEKLEKYSGTIFDEKLFQAFKEEVERFEKYRKGEIPNVLIVDSDISIANKLDRELWNKGYWVHSINSFRQAEERLKEEKIDLIVIDPSIDENIDIFEWIEGKKSQKNSPEFIIISSIQNQEMIERAMSIARDFLEKMSNIKILTAKLTKHIENIAREKKKKQQEARRTAGLSGSLEQLGLPELLQVLSQSRRTGRLTLTYEDDEGYVFLEDGQVVNAIYKEHKGEAAFGQLMLLEKGEFHFTPNIKTDERLIHKKLDGLILDTLRVIDESKRDGIDNPFDFPSSEFMAVFSDEEGSIEELEPLDGGGEEFEDLSLDFEGEEENQKKPTKDNDKRE